MQGHVRCHHRILLLLNLTVIAVLITVYMAPSSVLIIRHTWETDRCWGEEGSPVDRQFGLSSETRETSDQGSKTVAGEEMKGPPFFFFVCFLIAVQSRAGATGGGLENRPQTYENHEPRRARREPGNRMLHWPETQEHEHQGVFPLAQPVLVQTSSHGKKKPII